MHPKIPLPPNAKVLEIGSGHNPHPQATILCDKYLDNDQERQRKSIRYDRPLVIADANHLPFRDQSFDYVICSQLIEHIPNLQKFTTELKRVAKAGLITTPHALRERIFGWDYHRWFFDLQGDTILYHPKNPDEQTQFAHFMHMNFPHNSALRRYLHQHETTLNIYYYWEKTITLKPHPTPKAKFLQAVDKQVGTFLSQLTYNMLQETGFILKEKVAHVPSKINNKLRQAQWNMKLQKNPQVNLDNLQDLIVCPQDHTSLKIMSTNLYCSKCNTKFPIQNGLPILLNKKT